MKNKKIHFSFFTKSFSYLSIACATALALVTNINPEAKAAVIEFDSGIYGGSNPNTCTPQLPDMGGKCFIEDGFNVEAFSAQNIGSATAFYSDGAHFHASNSYEAQHFSEVDRLLGIYLTLVDGDPFSLKSLDYQLRENTRAISGYSTDDTKILISRTFDPNQPVSGQFTEYSLGSNLPSMFQTLNFSEFEDITQVYIASSGDVNFDNITTNTIPESSTLVGLLALGTMGFCLRRKESQR
ncbi:PEP-CTERM sorting domain-containing protein [Cyanothece sp. BG0011]|uniref:PEP-CTERM sorting domain-containing protein n=1 Tax=Cyanothece sp. BG0011 TaxID=2082950 RepID=UPI000D1D5C25|nr:PEP-CTERM sorting domain-containing protein [Cyanothece sp. BG0011]